MIYNLSETNSNDLQSWKVLTAEKTSWIMIVQPEYINFLHNFLLYNFPRHLSSTLARVEWLNHSSFSFKFKPETLFCNSIGITKLFKYALNPGCSPQRNISDVQKLNKLNVNSELYFVGFLGICCDVQIEIKWSSKVKIWFSYLNS